MFPTLKLSPSLGFCSFNMKNPGSKSKKTQFKHYSSFISESGSIASLHSRGNNRFDYGCCQFISPKLISVSPSLVLSLYDPPLFWTSAKNRINQQTHTQWLKTCYVLYKMRLESYERKRRNRMEGKVLPRLGVRRGPPSLRWRDI